MSHLNEDHFPIVPKFWTDLNEHLRKASQALNGVLNGETNNALTVILEVNETSTTVPEPRMTTHSVPLMTPLSASAAADFTKFWSEAKNGSIVIHHDSSPITDRKLGVVFSG